ncbi:uncharacterized protein BO95DRAFT_212774 [Aspergillus brunneoviolaceus CBS 621.78]|uniref:Uncharacterized protein n=1 Tax=Aspergillus brunneoviolaceus CBS 621.78 TaxID=1450534 RepID=A0ACD1G226_9EURO|nr:hypothetical protein BO95DRAFT_212774 [Aspergillus brunneoviolaceus CBS 621.78]RAH43281.1 hypothetical protein BO95DRAFT_212774 [Aspergillus brunneoviolaceus CBS 621.78]
MSSSVPKRFPTERPNARPRQRFDASYVPKKAVLRVRWVRSRRVAKGAKRRAPRLWIEKPRSRRAQEERCFVGGKDSRVRMSRQLETGRHRQERRCSSASLNWRGDDEKKPESWSKEEEGARRRGSTKGQKGKRLLQKGRGGDGQAVTCSLTFPVQTDPRAIRGLSGRIIR